MNIYHIILRQDWDKAQKAGFYSPDSLNQAGFIHCSTKEQVLPTANRRFSGNKNLLLLVINPEKVKAKIVFEDLSNIGEKHPHIYSKLFLTAVESVLKLELNDGGKFKQF
jgi:uncharacterized protein (DUF952 family)